MNGLSISVIIPVYNTEKYLEECLESVLHQTVTDYEIICVDDASTDSSPAILRKYEDKDPRIKTIFLDANKGQANARNYALKEAKGKYIFFLDSDDCIREDAFEKLLDNAEIKGTDILLFDYSMTIDEEDNYLVGVEDRYAGFEGIYEGPDIFGKLVNSDRFSCTSWSLFCLRSFLERKGILFWKNGLPHEDVLFNFMCFMKARRVSCLDEKLYKYRKREGATTQTHSKKRGWAFFYIFEEIVAYWRKQDFDESINSAITRFIRYALDSSRAQMILSEDEKDVEVSAADRFLYQLFINSGAVSETIPDELYRKIKGSGRIFIYGAGTVGINIYSRLRDYNIRVEKFIVTSTDRQPDTIMGTKVTGIQDINFNRPDLVIVAVSSKYRREIIEEIKKKRHENYYIV